MNIQNNGGEFFLRGVKHKKNSKKSTNEQIKVLKTAGGIFFSLIKKECGLTKDQIRLIFNDSSQTRKLERQNHKILKNLGKLLI